MASTTSARRIGRNSAKRPRWTSRPSRAVSTPPANSDAGDSERVLASLGAEGALLCGADGVLVADALDMDVVDTVGAGDALAAGYLAAIDDGESTETALRNGIAVASAVVERSGTSVPAFGDVASRRELVELRWYWTRFED